MMTRGNTRDRLTRRVGRDVAHAPQERFLSLLLRFSLERMPSSSSSTSISPRRCALSTVGGRSCARSDHSAMRKWKNARKQDRLAPSSAGSAVRAGSLEFIDELVPLSASPSCSPATPEGERDWIPTQDLTASPARPTTRSLHTIMGT